MEDSNRARHKVGGPYIKHFIFWINTFIDVVLHDIACILKKHFETKCGTMRLELVLKIRTQSQRLVVSAN